MCKTRVEAGDKFILRTAYLTVLVACQLQLEFETGLQAGGPDACNKQAMMQLHGFCKPSAGARIITFILHLKARLAFV